MRRGKPQQQIYRPGSGPLRKSNSGYDDSNESDLKQQHTSTNSSYTNNNTNNDIQTTIDDDHNLRSSSRRAKKPEQMLYVPKVVAQARGENYHLQQQSSIINEDRQQMNGANNSSSNINNDDRYGSNNRSKRYSNRRNNRPDNNTTTQDDYNNDEWRDKVPYRKVRQGSEPPRGFPNNNNNNSGGGHFNHQRVRDTRSVEPTIMPNQDFNSEKNHNKPPSGRRHSTIGLDTSDKRHIKSTVNVDRLPPRLKKKYLEENNLLPSNQQPQHSQPKSVDDSSWDGTSLTFQGSSNISSSSSSGTNHNRNTSHHHPHQLQQQHHHQQQQHHYQHLQQYPTLPSGHHHNYSSTTNSTYYTLPNRGYRGRGRLHRNYYDSNERPMYRSVTPDNSSSSSMSYASHSRPPTPPLTSQHSPPTIFSNRTRSSENLHHRAQSPNLRINNQRIYQHQQQSAGNEFNERVDDRSYEDEHSVLTSGFHDSLEKQLSPVSPPTPEGLQQQQSPPGNVVVVVPAASSSSSNTILDWSEEVELEAEAASDAALTRSSSIASLVEVNTKPGMSTTHNSNNNTPINMKRSRRKHGRSGRRSGSVPRDNSLDNSNQSRHQKPSSSSSYNQQHPHNYHHSNNNNQSMIVNDRRDEMFKIPHDVQSHNRNRRELSYERRHSNSISRDCSRERGGGGESGNWRDEIRLSRQNSERDSHIHQQQQHNRNHRNSEPRDDVSKVTISSAANKKPGVIILPSSSSSTTTINPIVPTVTTIIPTLSNYPDVRKQNHQQKSLFDPNNPNKPIIVKSSSSRVPGFTDNNSELLSILPLPPPPLHPSSSLSSTQIYTTVDQFGNIRPGWYDENSDGFKLCHYPKLICDIKRADNELQIIINAGQIIINWNAVEELRNFLKQRLEYLLYKDLRFCQSENVEQHLWKILYHNIIEITRKTLPTINGNDNDDNNNLKEQYKAFLIYLIDEGTKYFELLLERLEEVYKFKLNNYLGTNHIMQQHNNRGLGYIGLALISAQKLFLFLGDLARYREQVNETSNYGKCRQWYVKAHEINPKNGRPYNQLAVLAVYARRKLDAVYYYMRSLMSSNPVPSARECLNSLFDENRKKYEQGERKRKEERQERARQHMKEKESEHFGNSSGNCLRREIWIRPDGGRRVQLQFQEPKDSEEEDLELLSSVEVNKRFVISYLHVHGKLITKIGMESFHEAALQMLKEFRALLQHSPVPLPSNRFLQLLALNMFAIESTKLKDPHLKQQKGYRSELQERALVVSLQMFNLILERCLSLLQEHLDNTNNKEHADDEQRPPTVNLLLQDANILLPAIKIWCDWMLCHSSVWNPPPSTQDFKVGSSGDTWSRLALLMNLLEQFDQTLSTSFLSEHQDGYELVRLPEDGILSGFTPLMINEPEPNFIMKDIDMELAQFSLRLNKLLFFGTVFLCGLEPPVLKLEIEDDFREYVSVVCTTSSNSRDDSPSLSSQQELVVHPNNDVILESFSSDDDFDGRSNDDFEKHNNDDDARSLDIKDLLSRKVELEKRQRHQQLHMQRVKKILSQSVVSVEIEVRPKYLIPDTNCFIDHLDSISNIAKTHVYTLMVPIIVLSELEGLSRGGKSPMPSTRSSLDPQHVNKVAQSAKKAINFLKCKSQSVKCITTRGAIMPSMTFTNEDDSTFDNTLKNDDKILAICLILSKMHIIVNNNNNNNNNNTSSNSSNNNNGSKKEQQTKSSTASTGGGEPKKLVSEIVLLTDDRNLRVKALARDVPVRELSDFMKWAGLG